MVRSHFFENGMEQAYLERAMIWYGDMVFPTALSGHPNV